MLTESFSFNYMLKFKFSLSRHFEYANEQITCHFWLNRNYSAILATLQIKQVSENGRVVTIDFWLYLFLRNSRRKSGVGKMNGTVITNRLHD
jgi:hypothetical protein